MRAGMAYHLHHDTNQPSQQDTRSCWGPAHQVYLARPRYPSWEDHAVMGQRSRVAQDMQREDNVPSKNSCTIAGQGARCDQGVRYKKMVWPGKAAWMGTTQCMMLPT
jgi:hypothetical protein